MAHIDTSTPTTIDEYTDWNATRAGPHAGQPPQHAQGRRGRRRAARRSPSSRSPTPRSRPAAARPARPGVVVSGRHLSFVQDRDGDPTTAMAVTAQLVSKTGTLPRGLRAFVDVGTRPGRYGTPRRGRHRRTSSASTRSRAARSAASSTSRPTLTGLRAEHGATTTGSGSPTARSPATRTSPPRRRGDVARHGTTAPAPFTFTAFADVGTNNAPTDPKYAWGNDPAVGHRGRRHLAARASSTTTTTTRPTRSPAPTAPTRTRRVTQTNLMATQRPAFTLLAGDICYADPGGSGLPADDTRALTRTRRRARTSTTRTSGTSSSTRSRAQAAFTPWMFATGNHDMEPLYGNTEFLGGSPTHGYGGHVEAARPAQERAEDLPVGLQLRLRQRRRDLGRRQRPVRRDPDQHRLLRRRPAALAGGHAASSGGPTRTSRRAIDFVVAFFHHCAYSTTNNHASDGGVRAALDPLFTQVPGRPGRAGPQPPVRAHRPDQERQADPARRPDGSTIHPADRRRHLHLRRLRRPPALPVPAGARARPHPPPPGVDAGRPAGCCPRASATAATSRRAAPTRRRTTPRTS